MTRREDDAGHFTPRGAHIDGADRQLLGTRRSGRRPVPGLAAALAILVQAKVRPALVIVRHEASEVATQAACRPDDHMIETFAPDRANQAFNVGALPGRAGCRQDLRHPKRRDLIRDVAAEDAIPVTQQIAWCRLPRKGLAELLGRPCGGGVSGDTKLENSTSVVGKHQKDVQDLEPDRRHGEEVHRDDAFT